MCYGLGRQATTGIIAVSFCFPSNAAITLLQGEIGAFRAHVAAAQVNGDVRSQSLNFSKYAGSTS